MADEILNLNQSITDAESAFEAHKQRDADANSVKDQQITDLQTDNAAKDVRIAELEAQVGTGIPPAEVDAATSRVASLSTAIGTA